MPDAPNTFGWTPAHSVNIVVLDRQHQRLFDAVNELNQALRNGQGASVVDPVLRKLVGYVTVHFATEERLMEENAFPGLLAHRAEHEAFRRKIDAFCEDHKSGKLGVPVMLTLFMQNWLKDHVSKTDERYSAFLNARGVR